MKATTKAFAGGENTASGVSAGAHCFGPGPEPGPTERVSRESPNGIPIIWDLGNDEAQSREKKRRGEERRDATNRSESCL
jgi:hypothetical protein